MPSFLDRALGRKTLQGTAQIEGLFDVLNGQAGDKRSAPRLYLHKAFDRQLLNRLTDRRQADAELIRKLFHVQSLAGAKHAAQDRLPQGRINGIYCTFPLQSSQFQGGFLTINVPEGGKACKARNFRGAVL